jgi:hypothetical protein
VVLRLKLWQVGVWMPCAMQSKWNQNEMKWKLDYKMKIKSKYNYRIGGDPSPWSPLPAALAPGTRPTQLNFLCEPPVCRTQNWLTQLVARRWSQEQTTRTLYGNLDPLMMSKTCIIGGLHAPIRWAPCGCVETSCFCKNVLQFDYHFIISFSFHFDFIGHRRTLRFGSARHPYTPLPYSTQSSRTVIRTLWLGRKPTTVCQILLFSRQLLSSLFIMDSIKGFFIN